MADAADAIRKARAGVLLSDVYPVGSVVGTRQARRRRREPKAPASDWESAASAAADTARLQPRRPTVPPLSEAAACNAIIPERLAERVPLYAGRGRSAPGTRCTRVLTVGSELPLRVPALRPSAPRHGPRLRSIQPNVARGGGGIDPPEPSLAWRRRRISS